MQNDRGVRGDACNPKRPNPLGPEGRSGRSASIHPRNLRHRGVTVARTITPVDLLHTSAPRILQHNPVNQRVGTGYSPRTILTTAQLASTFAPGVDTRKRKRLACRALRLVQRANTK